MKERPTTYIVTWEFTLRFPSHYRFVLSMLRTFASNMEDRIALMSSHLVIEKKK